MHKSTENFTFSEGKMQRRDLNTGCKQQVEELGESILSVNNTRQKQPWEESLFSLLTIHVYNPGKYKN